MYHHHHLLRKRALRAITAGAILGLAWPAAAQVDVGLSPMKVEFPAVAGKSYSGSLSLSNAGTTKARIRVEMVDFYVDETTTPQFIAHVPSEAEYSCAAWLSANPMELEVQPKTQVAVRYTVRLPAGASQRSYHCALGFRTIPQSGDSSGTAMRTAVRLMTVFYAVVGKPPIAGLIKELKLEQVASIPGPLWRAVLIMENSGLMFYRPIGEVTVSGADGKVVEAQKVIAFPALPKRLQRYVLPLKSNLTPGPYTLRARIEVGGEIQVASVAVTAVALPPTEPAVAGPPPEPIAH
jgi:P pilus assembly chaperone PapD